MTFNDHPADPNYGGDRLQLFNIESPFMFSVQEFEAKWREVDNVWTQLGATKQLKTSGWTKTYDCRFKKRRVYSKKNIDMPVEKRRKTSTREADLCQAQITVTLKNGVVTV